MIWLFFMKVIPKILKWKKLTLSKSFCKNSNKSYININKKHKRKRKISQDECII